MYGILINRIPGEMTRISEFTGINVQRLTLHYLSYIFGDYLDIPGGQFDINDFLETVSGEMKIMEPIAVRLKLNKVADDNTVVALVKAFGGSSSDTLIALHQEYFQAGMRAMLSALSGLYDQLILSTATVKVVPRIYLSHFIIEYDTTGQIFTDHDEVVQSAIKSLDQLEYF